MESQPAYGTQVLNSSKLLTPTEPNTQANRVCWDGLLAPATPVSLIALDWSLE